ncbi:MAG TPA: hypothetical protein VNT29_10805 [Candidatus Limnocylindrales bacterium]|nr:hypothetical protein [Candidatus Limnocylindrales bacterium]
MSLFPIIIKTAIAQVATIHFLGIVVFIQPPDATRATRTESPSTITVAVMPNVPAHILAGAPITTAAAVPSGPMHKATVQPAPSPGSSQSAARFGSGVTPPENHIVEPHNAFLIFKDSDLLDVSGWEVKRFETGFLGIQLNGEHISFVADGPNQIDSSPLNLGQVTGQLRPEYLPPAYSDAAAVFSIPNGELAACAKGTNNPGLMTRIDTELRLINSGQLTVQSGTKILTVRGDASVVAAMVPFTFANHNELNPQSAAHYNVYCAMTGNVGPCSAPLADLSLVANPKILQCHDNTMITGGSPDSRENLPVIPNSIDHLLDVACSNSRWP